MSEETTDFFDNIGDGAGAPTAVLKSTGDFVYGTVTKMFKRDYVPFGQKEPEKKEDGTIRQQLVILVQTTLRNWQGVVKVPLVDHTDPSKGEKAPSEDDGLRAIYVPEKSNIQYAIGNAARTAGVKFEAGVELGVKIANLKDTGKGNPLKEHEAVIKPKPAPTGDEFFGGGAPATEAPAAAQEQAPAPASEPKSAPAASQDPWASSAPAGGTSEPPF